MIFLLGSLITYIIGMIFVYKYRNEIDDITEAICIVFFVALCSWIGLLAVLSIYFISCRKS